MNVFQRTLKSMADMPLEMILIPKPLKTKPDSPSLAMISVMASKYPTGLEDVCTYVFTTLKLFATQSLTKLEQNPINALLAKVLAPGLIG